MIPQLALTDDLATEYRECVAAVGSTYDLLGGRRRYRLHVRGAEVYLRSGAALVPADVVVAGATRSVHVPEEGWLEFTTSATRIVCMPAVGTAYLHLTELAS